ncbi:GNAT superfamily N-acetyltransferase [Sulfitobacter undariae]|uniref:GNAT superfamily N-acetyltransferase n=1 Tax=Sulfitobacter undariae TaxID=1563671 RepID=A0A7W6GZ00_9RHOB|nr:GNAT superfamily N-acetyltransferase [Sulfitobacter undariae]
MKVRQAVLGDAGEISEFLQQLEKQGLRTLPSDAAYVRSHYIDHADKIQCAVALAEDGTILGLQILKVASEGNVYGVTAGWGIIGTHVRPNAARRGVGKALFVATHAAAVKAELENIDASIGAANAGALSFYESIGFRTYRTPEGKVCKCFEVTA